MSAVSRIRQVRPGDVADLGERARRRARSRLDGIRARRDATSRSPYSLDVEAPDDVRLRELLPVPPIWLAPDPATVKAAHLWTRGWFDVLGSGWMPAQRGTTCRGDGGRRYPPGPSTTAVEMPAWIVERLPASSRATAAAIWSEVSSSHQPIDWNLDLRSGFRWDPADWHANISPSPVPGSDIKVPWELSRMQHLPPLAVLAVQAEGPEQARITRSSLDQLLDFLATSPPGFGAPWACAMDVAIRLVNIVVANEIVRPCGLWSSPSVRRILAATVVDHAQFIDRNLEWNRIYCGNHYLANLCGLLVAGRVLPPSTTTDRWLAFATSEIISEATVQLDLDGAGTEASTAYHRLTAEMLTFATAVMLSFDDSDWDRVTSAAPGRVGPCRFDGPRPQEVPTELVRRLGGASAFSAACVTPDGDVVQIGDDDSGRLLKLSRSWDVSPTGQVVAAYRNLDGYAALDPTVEYPRERSADHCALIDGIASLVAADPATTWDGQLIGALRRQPFGLPAPSPIAVTVGATEPELGPPTSTFTFGRSDPPGAPLDHDLKIVTFPSFGLVVFRSPSLFATFRCGPVGQNGRGGHAHCDQLAIEVWLDGRPVFRDPGMPTYCSDPALRNLYRSPAAHWIPNQRSDWSDSDVFGLNLSDGGGTLLCVRGASAVGQHRDSSGLWTRRVEVVSGGLLVQDWAPPGCAVTDRPPDLRVSPGYGWISMAPQTT